MNDAIHILHIEDNALDRALVAGILSADQSRRFTVTSVATMGEALAFLANDSAATVRLILLDLGLPDSHGLEGLVRIKSAWPQLPVVVITGNNDRATGMRAIELGARDYLIKGEYAANLANILEATLQMTALLRDVSRFTMMSTIREEPELTDLNQILKGVLLDLRPAIEASGANIEISSLPSFLAYPSPIATILKNLIENAIQHHGGGAPRIRVAANKTAQGWEIAVTDNGPGIGNRDIEKLFALSDLLEIQGGQPLLAGLPLCRTIVDKLGGHIGYQRDGELTTFHFTVPAVPPKPEATKP